MSYRIHHPGRPAEDLRAVALGQLAAARRDLAADDVHAGIHQARKRCKRIRALLRLIRAGLGNDDYRALNTAVRDAARPLSGPRDATALLECLDDLRAHSGSDDGDVPFAAARAWLDDRRVELVDQLDLDAIVEQAIGRLHSIETTVADWRLDPEIDGEVLVGGLAKTYHRGRKALAEAEDGDPERVHEWRKRTKYLRHQLELFQPAWKRPIKALRKELDALGDRLGEHHDLAVLRQVTDEDSEDRLGGPEARVALHAAIDRRSVALLRRALPLGHCIWTESRSAFADRMAAYWSAWEAASDTTPSESATSPGG